MHMQQEYTFDKYENTSGITCESAAVGPVGHQTEVEELIRGASHLFLASFFYGGFFFTTPEKR